MRPCWNRRIKFNRHFLENFPLGFQFIIWREIYKNKRGFWDTLSPMWPIIKIPPESLKYMTSQENPAKCLVPQDSFQTEYYDA